MRDGEQVRLTLDADLQVIRERAAGSREAEVLPMPAMAGRLILELKYRGAPPAIFRQLVEEFALAPKTASKYRLGVVASGQPVPKLSRQAPEPTRSMPEFLRAELQAPGAPLIVLGRLVAAMFLGGVVAWIYQRTRPATKRRRLLPSRWCCCRSSSRW